MSDDEDEINKANMVETERGLGRELSPFPIEGPTAAPGQGADWFSPLPPLRPIAPPEVAGRVRDFVPGINLTTIPRPEEPVTFRTLRALADGCDLLRIVIERRKDQLTRLPWSIRVKHDGVGRRPKLSALSPAMRGQIANVERFWKRPDPDYSFRQWLRKLLEDLFVLDAPSMYVHRNLGGGLYALTILDGSTIKLVLDDWGGTPKPFRWSGAPFMWLGVEINQSNFADRGFQLVDGELYPPAYQQILKGLPAVDYTTRDMIYRPLNPRTGHDFGMSPVEQVLRTAGTAVARATSQMEYYRENNMPAGLFSLPSSWTVDNVQRFQDYWDNQFSGSHNIGRRRQLRFIAGDGAKNNYAPFREPPLKNEFDEWLAKVICAAFSYPSTAFVHQVNRATAEQHEHQAETEGLEPLKQWFSDLANDVITNLIGTDEIEFAWTEENEVDQAKQAEILCAYVGAGVMRPNEAREALGLDPDPSPLASVLGVKTASGFVPLDRVDEDTATVDQQNAAAAANVVPLKGKKGSPND